MFRHFYLRKAESPPWKKKFQLCKTIFSQEDIAWEGGRWTNRYIMPLEHDIPPYLALIGVWWSLNSIYHPIWFLHVVSTGNYYRISRLIPEGLLKYSILLNLNSHASTFHLNSNTTMVTQQLPLCNHHTINCTQLFPNWKSHSYSQITIPLLTHP